MKNAIEFAIVVFLATTALVLGTGFGLGILTITGFLIIN